MIVEAVKKGQKIKKNVKCREKELLHFISSTDSNIFAQTIHPQVKKVNISQFGQFLPKQGAFPWKLQDEPILEGRTIPAI